MINTSKNRFFYICGEVTSTHRKANITSFVKKTYFSYFGIKLGDQNKEFVAHICCKTCVQLLRRWKSNIKSA